MKQKLGYLPEDRQIQALLLSWEIYRNASLASLEKYRVPQGIDTRREKEDAQRLFDQLSVKAKGIAEKVSALSGGNQQKVVLAKLLNMDLDVLILDEPTKGVDVGAKAQIYEIMTELAKQGYAIILISSEMPEVLAMSDRIGVMHEGHYMKTLSRDEATQEKLLAYAMNSEEMLKGGNDNE